MYWKLLTSLLFTAYAWAGVTGRANSVGEIKTADRGKSQTHRLVHWDLGNYRGPSVTSRYQESEPCLMVAWTRLKGVVYTTHDAKRKGPGQGKVKPCPVVNAQFLHRKRKNVLVGEMISGEQCISRYVRSSGCKRITHLPLYFLRFRIAFRDPHKQYCCDESCASPDILGWRSTNICEDVSESYFYSAGVITQIGRRYVNLDPWTISSLKLFLHYGQFSSSGDSLLIRCIDQIRESFNLISGVICLSPGVRSQGVGFADEFIGLNGTSLHLLQLPLHYPALQLHGFPLKNSDHYPTQGEKGHGRREPYQPFLTRSNAFLKGLYLTFLACVCFSLCAGASWIVWRFWNIRAVLCALGLYVICGLILFHLFNEVLG